MRRECDENVDSLRYVAHAGATEKGDAVVQVPRRSGREREDAREKFAEPGKTRDTAVSFGGGRVVVRSPSERRTITILIDIERIS